MEKQIACGDVVPGCSFEASAGSEQDLLQKVAQHARDSHGVQEITPELAARVKAAIRER
jgi:predicted small metal-binding protein